MYSFTKYGGFAKARYAFYAFILGKVFLFRARSLYGNHLRCRPRQRTTVVNYEKSHSHTKDAASKSCPAYRGQRGRSIGSSG